MAEQKQNMPTAALADYIDKANLRTTPVQNDRGAKTKNERANEAERSRTKQEAILRIIAHLTKMP